MHTPFLVVLTTLALFAGVVPFIDSVPLARAAGAYPQPSRRAAAWPSRRASPKVKRAPQDWSPPAPHPSPRSHEKRSQDEQNVLGGAGGVLVDTSYDDQTNKETQGWRGEGRCPEPLTACPVRGAYDIDAFECVDLWADLSSCGGCSTDDIVCVSLFYCLSSAGLLSF